MDDNKIADKWEFDNGVAGYTAYWDDESVPTGNATVGDGITNYEEYRGFYELLPDGSAMHVRLNPMKKELFVIDDDFMLSTYTWEQASGIPVYRVSENYVYGNLCGGDFVTNADYRLVNFCRGYMSGSKYAVNIIKINGIADPYTLCGTDSAYYGCSGVGRPRDVNLTILLPDRRRQQLANYKTRLQQAYDADPSAPTYLDGIPNAQMVRYINVLTNPRKFSMFLELNMKLATVHEVGHACGIDHHPSISEGITYCPMRYYTETEIFTEFLEYYTEYLNILDADETEVIIAEGRWRFCNIIDNCKRSINVNDR